MSRLTVWIQVLIWYLLSFHCCKRATLLTAAETEAEVAAFGKSLIRLGDGELNCIEGRDIHYQSASKELQREMIELVDEYIHCGGDCGYLLCMPNEFLKCSGWALARKRVWIASWSHFRYVFHRQYDVPLKYGDAFLFAEHYRTAYEKLWADKQEVVFLHNSPMYADKFREKYHKEVTFIQVSAKNCYSEIDFLTDSIRSTISCLHNTEKAVVLISAGPCAKVLIYRLRDLPVQMIDTGHCWDEPLTLR